MFRNIKVYAENRHLIMMMMMMMIDPDADL